MKRHRFHGRVRTLGDSCEADFLVIVCCTRCGARRQMHPYRLIARRKTLAAAPLETALPGFYCRTCRVGGSATVSCTYLHPGGW